MPSGDSAPYAIFRRAYQLAPACPMPREVVLATFNIVFSSKITSTAPAPSPWILRSTHPIEICFLKLFFFLWLVSLLFFEVFEGYFCQAYHPP